MKRMEQAIRGMGMALTVSMGVTVVLLLLQGRWREALPLHLCSLCALAAACLALRLSQLLLDGLWYLGMPGALLALVFPAPAVSFFQPLFNLSYAVTHLLILLIPALRMVLGMRPRTRRALPMFLLLQGAAAAAYLANRMLGTDFLFLAAPPAGTPLEGLFAFGYPLYLLALEALGALMVFGMHALIPFLPAQKQGRRKLTLCG